MSIFRGGRKHARRGESLMEVLAALSVFTIAMVGMGAQWVSARQQLNLVREQQMLARMIELTAEESRSIGPAYLPSSGAPRVRYFDSQGRPSVVSVADGYFSRTWITYLKNDKQFRDGTADTVGSSSLREAKIALYRTGAAKAMMESATFIAPPSPGNPL